MSYVSQLFRIAMCLVAFMPLAVYAEFPPSQQPALNKVSYQASIEKWAKSNTAKVTVSLDAVLDKAGLTNINGEMLQVLQKLAPGVDWHIIQFNRSEDKSGLETVHIDAEARLPGENLANLRASAKSLSKAGQTYTVSNIDFSPGLPEIEAAHAAARNAIYDQAKQEVERLNKIYPDQQYFLYSIDFLSQTPPVLMSAMPAPRLMAATPASPEVTPVNMAVDTKIVEVAQVIIASPTKTLPVQMRILPSEQQQAQSVKEQP